MTVRIYADFNDQDELGRVWLNTGTSLQDIERVRDLIRPGLPVVLYTDENDYVEVDAVLVYNDEHHVWLADWSGGRASSSGPLASLAGQLT
jgi:hypothetical protein